MIELYEKASIYAEDNVISVLKEAFAKVYSDGYRDGYKDREEEIPIEFRTEKTEFIDLGLPSGTLWADNYEQRNDEVLYLPYDKALNHAIPSEDQWKELVENCRWLGDYSSSGLSFYGITCIGPNGNSIRFGSAGFVKNEQTTGKPLYGGGSAYFWLCEKADGNEKKSIKISGGKARVPEKEVIDMFSGYKLPIRLVKTK